MHFNIKKKSTIIIVIIAILILGGGYLYCKINIDKPFTIESNKNNISIQGWWNADINNDTIESIQLIQPPLNVNSQELGGKLGSKIFGKANLKNYGKTRCFIENHNDEAIYIKTTSENYAINFTTNENTLKEYNYLKSIKS